MTSPLRIALPAALARLLALLLLCGAPAPAAAADIAVPYDVLFVGLEDDPAMSDLIEQSSLLVSLQEKPPASVEALRRRAEEDVERFREVLRSEAYYDGKVSYDLQRSEKVAIVISFVLGPDYLFAGLDIAAEGCAADACAAAPTEEDLGLALGQRARSADIVGAIGRITRWYENRGHPWAAIEKRDAVVDHDLLSVQAAVTVRPGRRVTFGQTSFSGADTVARSYLDLQRPWKPGDVYDARKLTAFTRRLDETGLFDSVTVRPAAEADADGALPVEVTLTAGKPRSIGAGTGYSTAEGFGVSAFWEHRNFFGAAESLRLSASASEINQTIGGNFRKPAFLRDDQDLLASSAFTHKTTDAFDSTGIEGQVGLEKRVSKNLRTGISVLADSTQISDAEGTENSYLFGLPLVANWDYRDSLLDPTSGVLLNLQGTPFAGYFRQPVSFLKLEAAGSWYYGDLPIDGLVFALRGRLGGLAGAETEGVPATRRFYSGGGGSVRGYEFEKVGPLDDELNPLGGRSVVEVGAELRFRLPWDLGLVPFIEGGNVYDESYPTFERPLLWAAGLGLRYYTALGPVRLDLAFPLNGRDNIDDVFQFYISIGQAF